ncbi:glycosyltransferase [Nonomuraea sediminis]|uniref:glycosyltransferase n=1 Tax=Nonomuraea sediminis TaxID=2835864 RepID=UPI001BDC00E5|nr:glycosyltransferase [Nonomuraea sediminis]
MRRGRIWLSLTLLVTAVAVGLAARTPGWTAVDGHLAAAVESARTPWLTGVAQVLNVGFGTVVGTFLSLLLVAGLAAVRQARKALLAAVVVAAGWGMGTLVKEIVARPRPPAAHALVHEVGADSFPSGHVCLTLSLVIALALLLRRWRRLVVALGAVLVLAQMLARVYLGAHYPTDTVGSLMVSPSAISLALGLPALGLSLLRAANRRRASGPADTRHVRFLLLHANGMGGTIRTVFTLAGSLAAEHDVEIVSVIRTRQEPFFPVPHGVRVSYLVDLVGRSPLGRSLLIPPDEAAYAKFDLRTDVALVRFLRGLRGGVLITTRPGLNLVAALLAPPGVLTVAQEHVGYGTHRPAVQKMIKRRYGRLSALVTLTEADLKDYRVALGERAPGQLVRIPNATPPLSSGPSPLTEPAVVAIGRLTKVKGFDLLLRAWARAVAERPGWSLRIVGSGPQRSALAALVDELGLGGSVTLTGASRDIGAEFDRASIFVLSSRHEGFPMTILESLSKGVPVVSFDCPYGPGEIITHDHDGLLVPPGDLKALAAELGGLMDDPAARRRMSDQALLTSRLYDPEPITAEWERLLTVIGHEAPSAEAATRP